MPSRAPFQALKHAFLAPATAARSLPIRRALPRPSTLLLSRPLHSTPPRRAPAATAQLCPSCSAPLPPSLVPLCPACNALLPPPPPSTSYFALFDLEPAFALDQTALKNAYRKYQQKVHPDLYASQGEKETWAKSWSGRVNDAFKILEGDLSRGEYLLTLSGVAIGEADGVTDPELLMSIMETREELEEASTEEQVAEIRRLNEANVADTISKLATACSTSPPDVDTAKNLVIKLRYLENVEGVCKEWAPGRRIELQH